MRDSYDHTQNSPLQYLFYLIASMMLVISWFNREDMTGAIVGTSVAAILLLCAMMFRHLRVRDEGDMLDVRFGPLAIFGTRIAYHEMTAVEADRSSFIEGWGIHWRPGKGWIFNIWGFACVEISLGDKKKVRVGTDDVDNLISFLESKIDDNQSTSRS